jgi:hypothetical protein
MRTAAHSCLMTRKSRGGARTTAPTTELSASAVNDASDSDALLPAPLPLCEDELRHSRVHFRPFPPTPLQGLSRSAAGLSPTSVRIHLPDAPIAASQSQSPKPFPTRIGVPLQSLQRAVPHNTDETKRPNEDGARQGRWET